MPPANRATTKPNDGFKRYRDPKFQATAVKLLPGQHYVTNDPDEMIVTVLGSCVSACIRDPASGLGGMNHFMLPSSGDGHWGKVSACLRYGNFAMEQLINDVLKAGGTRARLEVKVFGGANVLQNGGTVGHQNSEFVEHYLQSEGLSISARHLYGEHPRRLHYFPRTGRVSLLLLATQTERAEQLHVETTYHRELAQTSVAGSVELF